MKSRFYLKFTGRYLVRVVTLLIAVSIVSFILVSLSPVDPVQQYVGAVPNVSVEQREKIAEYWGLNDPPAERFMNWGKALLHGDFGTSYRTGQSVTTSIFERYPTTLLVAGLGVVFTALLGISLGIISAVKQYSIWDNLATVIGMVGVSMPSFFVGLVLIILFCQVLGILPASGYKHWYNYIMPIMTISFGSMASQMRMTRSSMLEVMRQDYVRTARAKGQSEKKVVLHHQLKNAMINIITVIGTQAAYFTWWINHRRTNFWYSRCGQSYDDFY